MEQGICMSTAMFRTEGVVFTYYIQDAWTGTRCFLVFAIMQNGLISKPKPPSNKPLLNGLVKITLCNVPNELTEVFRSVSFIFTSSKFSLWYNCTKLYFMQYKTVFWMYCLLKKGGREIKHIIKVWVLFILTTLCALESVLKKADGIFDFVKTAKIFQ